MSSRGRGGGGGGRGGDRGRNRMLGPAAGAMRNRAVFRDLRAAEEQVTVEKLFRDAAEMHEFHSMAGDKAPRAMITSPEELALYRQKRRGELEESVRRGYGFLGNWTKYAQWEAQQGDFTRMRSVFERATEFHGTEDGKLWRAYAEMEAAHGFVSHARAVWDRAVAALPYETELWLKALALEQAAGDDARTRELFQRWLRQTGAAAPHAAYELFAWYEASRGRVEGCRDVLRRYVEAANTPAAWLLYSAAERDVLRAAPGTRGSAEADTAAAAPRAVRVLEAAMRALPDALLWGPLECRVPLRLAETQAHYGNAAAARESFRQLLNRLQDQCDAAQTALTTSSSSSLSSSRKRHRSSRHNESGGGAAADGATAPSHDAAATTNSSSSSPIATGTTGALQKLSNDVFGVYERFEKAHGNVQQYEALRQIHTRRAYGERIAANPADMDAHLSLYLSLRAEARQAEEQAEKAANSGDAPAAAPDVLWGRCISCLERALAVPTAGMDGHTMQKRAVLACELARRLEASGELTRARQVFAAAIQTFPFATARCPRLWTEAAELEVRHGDYAQARKLLRAASNILRDPAMFDTALRLESAAAAEAGGLDEAAAAAEYTASARAIYQDAIQAFPDDEQRWLAFAKLEEGDGQPARAAAICAAAVKLLSSRAYDKSVCGGSVTARYELLGKVDTVWAYRLHLARKEAKKKLSHKSGGGAGSAPEGGSTAGDAASSAEVVVPSTVVDVHRDLIRHVWECYEREALEWRRGTVDKEHARQVQQQQRQASNVADDLPVLPVPPSEPPAVLRLPSDRLSQALQAVATFYVSLSNDLKAGGGGSSKARKKAKLEAPLSAQDREAAEAKAREALLVLRGLLRGAAAEAETRLRAALATAADVSYDEDVNLRQWCELLTRPIAQACRALETQHAATLAGPAARADAGGAASLTGAAATAVVQAVPKRRTRLFAGGTI